MADNMVEDEFSWLSAELRILEAEYEKSKLRVFQDTLLCKRSMVELELLCKNEQLQKNTRVSNKREKHESQLQEQLETLSTELQNTTEQLQTAQHTIQDEQAHHDLEKKKLQDKLNLEMEKKIEEQRESASNRENLLQEEIKNWQDKHVKTFKEAEVLRMELRKKNVAVKTKAIQTRVTVEDVSTMAQVDPQTCDVGVQVLELAAVDEGFQKNNEDVLKSDEDIKRTKDVLKSDEDFRKIDEDVQEIDEDVQKIDEDVQEIDEDVQEIDEDVRKIDEDVREIDDVGRNKEDVRKTDEVSRGMDDTGKGRKGVAVAKERNNNKRMVKDSKPERNRSRNDKRNLKRKGANQGKGNENEMTDKEVKKESQKSLRKRKCRSTKEERDVALKNSLSENHHKLRGRTKAINAYLASSASQEDEIPLQYSKTPSRLRKKSDESNQSLDKSTEKSNIGTDMAEETAAASVEKNSTSEKQSENSLDNFPQLAVFVEDIGKKQVVNSFEAGRVEKVHKEDVHDDIDATGKKSSQQHTVEERQNRVVMQEDKGFLSLTVCQKRLEEESTDSKRANVFEDLHNNESTKGNGRKSKEKRENKRKKKTKEDKSTGKKGLDDDTLVQERAEDEGEKDKGGRVLRSRTTKKRSYEIEVEIDPCKVQGDDSKTVGTETTQKPHDNEEPTTTKKCKSDDICLKGHEPAMSPEANQLAGESELSSREIVSLVDEPPSSQGVTSRATANHASQQPETEMQGELNVRNNRGVHDVRLTDYDSVQGSSDLKYNRVTEVGEAIINKECDHKALEEVKSGKSFRGKNGEKKASPEGKNIKNVDLSSTKRTKRKQTEQKFEDIGNACVLKIQDSDALDPDNNKSLTRQKAKSSFQDTGHSKRKGSRFPAEPSVTVCEKTATTLKENAPNGKTTGKKRKTSSVRKVLTPADQQSSSDVTTSTEISSMLDNTKKRKTLFNSRENSLMVPNAKVQISFANTTHSKSRSGTGIPPSLSAFMRSFIAPKLKKSH